jgi:uncharacterized damage-inducible protein DinB
VDLNGHFRMLASYNRLANDRLYDACARLDDVEYRKPRAGSLGSIHALLNHLLLGDRIWMDRFEGAGHLTPPLDAILYDDFPELRAAQSAEDQRIERFFESINIDFFSRTFAYINRQGRSYVEAAPVAVAHFFNHQTHHRAQVHVMLSQTGAQPPSLDLHRIVNP